MKLRKDCMTFLVEYQAREKLHPECFVKISNSPINTPLEVGCVDCRKIYEELAKKKPTNRFNEVEVIKRGRIKGIWKMPSKRELYENNIELERQNAILQERVNNLVNELKKLRLK